MQGIKGYAPLFQKAFGSKEITMPRIAQAIASYERTVVSGNSPYDRYIAGDKDAMSASAVRGMAVFNSVGNCKTCHTGFNFTDESYHNLGVGMDKPKPDLGRFEISKAESEKGAFKTPTLRNITQTAPYMHDGSEATLRSVVELYNRGGVKNQWLSKEIKPLNLAPQQVRRPRRLPRSAHRRREQRRRAEGAAEVRYRARRALRRAERRTAALAATA